MCEVYPAPRCASGTRKTLETSVRQVRDLREEFYAAKERRDADPENESAKIEYATVWRKFNKARTKLKNAQRDHDGTPTGQKELRKSLAETTDPKERKNLERRLREGDQLRDWRLHHRNQQKLEKETGMTMRQRRGNFLTNPGMANVA